MKKIIITVCCVLTPFIISWCTWVSSSMIKSKVVDTESKQDITEIKQDVKGLYDKLDDVKDEIINIYKNKGGTE